jgi:hypothetical protein
MSVVADRIVTLESQLKMVVALGGAVVRDMGAPLASLPAVVIGPPELLWETGCLGPTSMRLLLYVVIDADERALERLWDLVPLVADAADATEAAVISAVPGTYGTPVLPAYEITLEMPL